MNSVYYWYNGEWVYAGNIRKTHRVNDVLKLNGVPFKLKVDNVDYNDASVNGCVMYCLVIE